MCTHRVRVRAVKPSRTRHTIRRSRLRVVPELARHHAASVRAAREPRGASRAVVRASSRVVPVGARQLHGHRGQRAVKTRRARLARRSIPGRVGSRGTLVKLGGLSVGAVVAGGARRAVGGESDREGSRAARDGRRGRSGAGESGRAPGAAGGAVQAVVALRAGLLRHRGGRTVVASCAPVLVWVLPPPGIGWVPGVFGTRYKEEIRVRKTAVEGWIYICIYEDYLL